MGAGESVDYKLYLGFNYLKKKKIREGKKKGRTLSLHHYGKISLSSLGASQHFSLCLVSVIELYILY